MIRCHLHVLHWIYLSYDPLLPTPLFIVYVLTPLICIHAPQLRYFLLPSLPPQHLSLSSLPYFFCFGTSNSIQFNSQLYSTNFHVFFVEKRASPLRHFCSLYPQIPLHIYSSQLTSTWTPHLIYPSPFSSPNVPLSLFDPITRYRVLISSFSLISLPTIN